MTMPGSSGFSWCRARCESICTSPRCDRLHRKIHTLPIHKKIYFILEGNLIVSPASIKAPFPRW